MGIEHYTRIYDGWPEGITVRPGKSCSFRFNKDLSASDSAYRLFICGETSLHYLWKNEPDMPYHYRSISDALDTEHACQSQYCLDLSSKKPEEYIKRIYKKAVWPPVLSYLGMNPIPEQWQFGIRVKTDDLSIADGGYFRIVLEVRHIRDNVSRRFAGYEPDEKHIIDIPCGTTDWTLISKNVCLPKDTTANVGFWIEACNYSGNVYVEAPFLSADGENLLPDFTQSVGDKEHFDWTAQNISRKEWPSFRVLLNGTEVFNGDVFERCHRASEWELALPVELLKEKDNELIFTLTSDYHDPLPYIFRELGIIKVPANEFSILAVPPAASVGHYAGILVKTNRDDVTVTFSCESKALTGDSVIHFSKKGLHGLRLSCLKAGNNVSFSLTSGTHTETAVLPRIVLKEQDRVITGTGDLIYVNQNSEDFAEFLSWYISEGIGSLVTLRPVYRWCGSRTLNKEAWKLLTRVLNELGIKYALMADGRELPGLDANPDDDLLAGEGYLGRQDHERDGQLFYWGFRSCPTLTEEQYADMDMRISREHPENVPAELPAEEIMFSGEHAYDLRMTPAEADQQAAHDEAIRQLVSLRKHTPRHTGPSVMFRNFYEAGYRWAGAETMYSSTELLMAFERGAAECYGSDDIGVHHAVQWSSTPHDAEDHFRRYRLALYISYMQGATEINTEEGLWHMEEYYAHFNRFSHACLSHLKQQTDFYRYVSSHSRTGWFYSAAAFVHGRLDGWHDFGMHNPWGLAGETASDAEKSWELWKVPYPMSVPGYALYVHGADPYKPIGYHSGNPYGNIDAIPMEADNKQLNKYKVLIFAGYNKATPEDMDKLVSYMEQGGTVLMTRAHFATATARSDIHSYDLKPIRHPITLCNDECEYRLNSYHGSPVQVCTNLSDCTVLERCDDGTPLLIEKQFGMGKLILLNANAYPAHPAIKELYTNTLSEIAERLAAEENAFVECGNDVQFAVYDQRDGSRHIYVTPVDWYNQSAEERKFVLRINGKRNPMSLPFGVMIKIVINGTTAAWPMTEDGEVLRVSENEAVVQGCGTVPFFTYKNGILKKYLLDMNNEPIQTIRL